MFKIITDKNVAEFLKKISKYIEGKLIASTFDILLIVPWMLVFSINPITYGGGGLFGPDHQIIDHNSKTALSSTSKLGDL